MQQATYTFAQTVSAKTNNVADVIARKEATHKILLFVAIISCVIMAVHI